MVQLSSQAEAGRGARCRPVARPLPPGLLICAEAASAASGIALDDLLAPGPGVRPVSTARALAIYLAHVGLGLPLARVAEGFHRHRTSVDHACRRIEERREIAGWDHWVGLLEEQVRARLAGEGGDGA
ncbi:helix-turn-helix domain-containing protein [Ancylobacter radicis]|uniref:Chromosomal replication initiator DnaA n=1 Tax=Ancylobacter radicis TaxID=2836179 RepID=A0ABS5RAX0_9HYPH|nr:helix-turn-helix domain-containing protein [Ancylobacter radicis]MBS9478806.1 chromosomal replication initiator DnaA [Ancylobacter radicis]